MRVHELALAIDSSAGALAAASGKREQKEAEVAAQDAVVADCYALQAEASRAAENPGIAPGMPQIAPGVGRISDLDEETRQYLGLGVLLASAGRGENAPARPDRAAALKDQSRFRVLGSGVIISPKMTT